MIKKKLLIWLFKDVPKSKSIFLEINPEYLNNDRIPILDNNDDINNNFLYLGKYIIPIAAK